MAYDLLSVYPAKLLEYGLGVGYLLLFIPFWRYVQGSRREVVALCLFCRNLHGYFQNAVLKRSLRIFGFRAFGKRNRAIETSVTAFGSVITFAFFLAFLMAFARDNERVIRYFNLNIFFFHSG